MYTVRGFHAGKYVDAFFAVVNAKTLERVSGYFQDYDIAQAACDKENRLLEEARS